MEFVCYCGATPDVFIGGGGISVSDAELQDIIDSHASTAKDQGRVVVTTPKSDGNKRPRVAEDVNWDKRRRLKMMFYHVTEGLCLSQTKDPNYGKEEMNTQSDEVTEVGQNPKLG
ncbi:hypothetical protein K7X08_025876 [Anisodus acutangulus]|uniref:Uncharacterized protein n=1 Tax=Anisodus acutangulus TaxID=402998 RepID=A0A9Q1QW22_9SOLA|nr:hypothetical protein K7X08_025876 [Anisodus acutangulus]